MTNMYTNDEWRRIHNFAGFVPRARAMRCLMLVGIVPWYLPLCVICGAVQGGWREFREALREIGKVGGTAA